MGCPQNSVEMWINNLWNGCGIAVEIRHVENYPQDQPLKPIFFNKFSTGLI
jgi:hypothetical protein